MKSQMQTTKEMSGIIHPEALYTLVAFKKCLNVGDALIRAARGNGLRVHYRNRLGFILGSDWISYVTSDQVMEQPPVKLHRGSGAVGG